MATALKCDRCGKYYDQNYKIVELKGRKIPVTGMTFVNSGITYTMYKDLCDECLGLLADFLNTVGIEPTTDEE